MKYFLRVFIYTSFTLHTLTASAELFTFSYTFDNTGHILTGVVDGTLQLDGDTIVINSFVQASLAGHAYIFNGMTGIQASSLDEKAVMSLSGATLDFWVCSQGFTVVDTLGRGDCPFGAEGGFLISENWPDAGSGGAALAGIQELGASFRDRSIPLNPANWNAGKVREVTAIAFSYTFDANFPGQFGFQEEPGLVLAGVIDGRVMPDNDTIEIVGFREISLGGFNYSINSSIAFKAALEGDRARMSFSGNILDFWVCPRGYDDGSEDCSFGSDGGFLISENWPDTGSGGAALAGIPELGSNPRVQDRPIGISNWNARILTGNNALVAATEQEPNDSEADANSIGIPGAITGSLSMDNNQDYFKFTASGSGNFQFELNDNSVDANLDLFIAQTFEDLEKGGINSNGASMGAGPEKFTQELTEGQDYFLGLFLESGNSSNYTLTITDLGARMVTPPEKPSIDINGMETSAIIRGGISNNGGNDFIDQASVGSTVNIFLSIDPELDHIGRVAGIIVAVKFAGLPDIFLLNSIGKLKLLQEESIDLFREINLSGTNSIAVFGKDGISLTADLQGSYEFFAGYILDDVIYFNAEPILLEIVP